MLLTLLSTASAESFESTSPTAVLRADTELFVNVLSDGEVISWQGSNPIIVTSPSGTAAELNNEESMLADSIGIWSVALTGDEGPGWALSSGQSPTETGRVFSYLWHFDTGDEPMEERFYVPVPGFDGADPFKVGGQINKIFTEGIRGEAVFLAASRTGLNSTPGYSNDGDFSNELPIFLEYPDYFNRMYATPTLSDVQISYDADECEMVVPGYKGVEVTFSTTAVGQPVLSCDQDEDGQFDLSGAEDVAMLGPATPGLDGVYWNGFKQPLGEALPLSGDLKCRIRLLIGPMHALLSGAYAADPGVRLFYSVDAATSDSMAMMWNDIALAANTVTDDLTLPMTASTEGGVLSGDVYQDGEMCTQDNTSCTAHGWGGREIEDEDYGSAWVDTWGFDALVESADLTITLASSGDEDNDNLASGVERCIIGTYPDVWDSDGDSLDDGSEVGADIYEPTNIDGDELIDALDEDDDGDDIDTLIEINDTNAASLPKDLDKDGVDNWHDLDSDGDGILDQEEPTDADESGIPDYLESADGDSEPRDTGSNSGTLTGIFQGGVGRCAVAPGTASLWGGLVLLMALRRRRSQ